MASHSSARFSLRFGVCAVIALILAASGVLLMGQAGDDVTRTTRDVDGIPIEIFSPAHPTSDRLPAVLVAHGFSGNRQLMYGFGYTLARNGYVAGLIDFAGHGASAQPLRDSMSNSDGQLIGNIDTALKFLRQWPGVDSARVAILGHSMGAGLVTMYGAEHPDVPATIAISLGGMGNLLDAQKDRPRNLLTLAGANEFRPFIDGSLNALKIAYAEGSPGITYGDFARGTARRAMLIPTVEHISILFSHDTYREVVRWLDGALQVSAGERELALDSHLRGIGLLYLAAALGFYPLAHGLFRHVSASTRTAVDTPSSGRPWLVLVVSSAGAVVTPLIVQWLPLGWLPITVGNYMGVYFLLYGALLLGALLLTRRWPTGLARIRLAQAWLPALILVVYVLLTLGLPAHLGLSSFALVGPRLWLAPVLMLFLFAYFWADELWVGRFTGRRRVALYALTKLILIVSLMASIFVFGAPFFLALLVPVFALVFVWHGLYSYWLAGLTRAPWLAALINAVALGWFVAATFPIVG
jgi:dienelactone hydrolase